MPSENSTKSASSSHPAKSAPQNSTTDATTSKRHGALSGAIASNQGYLSELPGGCRIVAGNVGDHALIVPLLEQIFQTPMIEDFQSRTDEPNYSPSDRLLIKHDQQIVGHLQVSRRIGWFQGHRIPLVKLQDLVILPEYDSFRIDRASNSSGASLKESVYGSQLLEVAEGMALREGAILGLVHSNQPQWFERRGWSRCRGQGHTQADARAILSHLDAQESLKEQQMSKVGNKRIASQANKGRARANGLGLGRRRETIQVRTWRHFELDALRRIYGQVAAGMWGPLHRSEKVWQWLVGRKAQDQILLAMDTSLADGSASNTVAPIDRKKGEDKQEESISGVSDSVNKGDNSANKGDHSERDQVHSEKLRKLRSMLSDRFGDNRCAEGDPYDEEEDPSWHDEVAENEKIDNAADMDKMEDAVVLKTDRLEDEASAGKKSRGKKEGEKEDISNQSESILCDPQNVVGYAVVRDSSIVEMFTLPGYDLARAKMIAVACRDAIDRDHHFVSLHTPAVDPMHELLITAGGRWHDNLVAMGGIWMVKLLSPEKWIERLYPILHERAREAGLNRPLEIGITTGTSNYRLTVTRRSARLEQGEMPARHLTCNWHALEDLLASNMTLAEASTESRMEISGIDTATNIDDPLTALAALFPPKLFWQSPFELLRL